MKPEALTIHVAAHVMTVTRAVGIQWCTTHHGIRVETDDDTDQQCDNHYRRYNDYGEPLTCTCTLTDLYHQTPAP